MASFVQLTTLTRPPSLPRFAARRVRSGNLRDLWLTYGVLDYYFFFLACASCLRPSRRSTPSRTRTRPSALNGLAGPRRCLRSIHLCFVFACFGGGTSRAPPPPFFCSARCCTLLVNTPQTVSQAFFVWEWRGGGLSRRFTRTHARGAQDTYNRRCCSSTTTAAGLSARPRRPTTSVPANGPSRTCACPAKNAGTERGQGRTSDGRRQARKEGAEGACGAEEKMKAHCTVRTAHDTTRPVRGSSPSTHRTGAPADVRLNVTSTCAGLVARASRPASACITVAISSNLLRPQKKIAADHVCCVRA